MSDNDFDVELDLLVPWDIPLEDQLDSIQQEKATKALKILLRSLEATSIEIALKEIDLALNYLGEIETTSADIIHTKTSLKNWEVADYDRYFKINRVRAKQPALCLVQGLLVDCRTFFCLCQSSANLDPMQLKIQKQGFISYAYLLARNFQLDL